MHPRKAHIFLDEGLFLCALCVACLAAFASPARAEKAMKTIPADSPLRYAPQVASVRPEELPQAQLLGTPEVRTLVGYTRRVLHLHDGHTLAVFSFSGAAKANWIFLIDSRTLSSRRFAVPNNDIASHGGALGADDNIYIMPYGSGRAYRFETASGKFTALETGVPNGEFTWDALGASNGCIYFGTYPHAYLGEYNCATGKCTLWKQVAPNTTYVTQFSEDSTGHIHFRAWGPDSVWMTLDPKTHALERSPEPAPVSSPAVALPEPPPGDTYLQQATIEGRHFGLGFPTGRLWELKAGEKPALCGDARHPAEAWFLEKVPGAVVGISHFGASFRYDLQTGQFRRGTLRNRAPAGNGIMFIEALTPRCVLGANYSQQNLFKIDPETGKTESAENMVARVSGEPMCAVGFEGMAYVGIYVRSLISLYDPAQPFAFGKNPRELIELGTRYHQTRPRAAVTDGKLVFISSDSEYNYLGGALAVIDPKTEHIDVYPQLIPDQNLPTLAYDPATHLLWGGTDRWGQMHSHPPTQPDALLYAFSPATRQVVTTLTPWHGTDVVSALGVANGVLVAASGAEIALIDTTTHEVLYKGPSPIAIPRQIRTGADGNGYCLSDGTLYRWDLRQNRLAPVATAPGCAFLTETSPQTWALASSTSVYRVQLSSTRKEP